MGSAGPRLARDLEYAAALLVESLDQSESSPRPLAEAKNKALQIEDIRRRGRRAAMAGPRLAEELAARAVLDHFSRAGEAVHRAADALASHLGENQ